MLQFQSNMTKHRIRRATLVFVAAMAGSILLASIKRNGNEEISSSSSLRQHRRQLMSLVQYADPKTVTLKSDAPRRKKKSRDETNDNRRDEVGHRIEERGEIAPLLTAVQREQFIPVDYESRKNCQIIYITGVEGATHHGFIPIVEALARNQIDPESGLEYIVDVEPKSLKAGLFGWKQGRIRKWGFAEIPAIDDPAFVQRVVSESCPNDGRKHVLIEWASFPSGQEDDPRNYRVPRNHEWLTMTPEEIANTEEALNHPTNMNAFYQSYSPYIDIKFIVLHRPFLETIASHRDWDGGPLTHSNIIRGFMLMLRRFLDTHLYDLVSGRKLWCLVCVERIMAKNYETKRDVIVARRHVLSYLTAFLDWPSGDCSHCFDNWRESTKDPLVVLGEENVAPLMEHMKELEGVWPPPGELGIAEQQCGI